MPGALGVPDARGNILADTVSCYDPLFSQPDFHLDAASPCVNAGVAGTHADNTPNATDITGGPRVLGGSADIGCFEKQ